MVGDKMEVSWQGKFRLETLDVFVGRSWWGATVVEKVKGYRYRIHYPGWDSRWDECVSRDRLRWPVDRSSVSTAFKVRDAVEVWCTGNQVEGAWLQAKIRRVKGDHVCLGNVLASSHRMVWVPRDSCRKIISLDRRTSSGGNLSQLLQVDPSWQVTASRIQRSISTGVRMPLMGLRRLCSRISAQS
ncbi:unnamed protein product [Discosporangium mesarthrocarpum]